MVFFYLVTTGSIFDIISLLCENSINQSMLRKFKCVQILRKFKAREKRAKKNTNKIGKIGYIIPGPDVPSTKKLGIDQGSRKAFFASGISRRTVWAKPASKKVDKNGRIS